MAGKPKTFDEYLATLDRDKRATLTKLRTIIRAVLPEAEECISYGVPSFRLDGRYVVGLGASARHCSFYPGSAPIEDHEAELKNYDTGKGTIRFPVDNPLPSALVRKLVQARIAALARARSATLRQPAKAPGRKASPR